MVGFSPFQKFNLSDQLWFNPNALFHLFGSHTLAPARPMLFGKIDERTIWNYERPQLFEKLAPTGWHKSVPGPCDINQFFAPIIAENYCVQTVQARRIATDDEFLSAIDAMFNPRATPCTRLIETVFSLIDYAPKLLLTDSLK